MFKEWGSGNFTDRYDLWIGWICPKERNGGEDLQIEKKRKEKTFHYFDFQNFRS